MRFHTARRHTALATCVLLALAGCRRAVEEPRAPAIVGSYALVSGNGVPVPLLLWREPSGASATLRFETLTFSADGRAERSRALLLVSAAGDTTREATTIAQAYRVDGARVVVGWFTPCPPNALCVGNDEGTWDASGVSLESRLYWLDRQPGRLRYERRRPID